MQLHEIILYINHMHDPISYDPNIHYKSIYVLKIIEEIKTDQLFTFLIFRGLFLTVCLSLLECHCCYAAVSRHASQCYWTTVSIRAGQCYCIFKTCTISGMLTQLWVNPFRPFLPQGCVSKKVSTLLVH